MIQQTEIIRADGRKIKIDYYELHHRKHNFNLAVWAIDFTIEGYEWYFKDGIQAMMIGKLSEATALNAYFPLYILRKVLDEEGWDWNRYPDPELLLLKSTNRIIEPGQGILSSVKLLN